MNVIYYERPEHVTPIMGVKDRPIWFESFVVPFQSLKNYFYGDLKHFSNIQVKVLSDGKNNIAYPK